MQKSFIKKPISVLLSILMVLSVFGVTAFAGSPSGSTVGDLSTEITVAGSFGTLNYVIDKDGVLTFSGSGEIPAFAFETNTDVRKVIINDSVTKINGSAFKPSGVTSNLTEVVIENPNVEMRGSTFENCDKLTTVTLPEGMKKIVNRMFNDCSALTTIELPSTIEEIDYGAFSWSGLQSITMPAGVKISNGEMGYAFFNVTSLQTVTVKSDSPATFSGGEFSDSSLSALTTANVPVGSAYVYTPRKLEVVKNEEYASQMQSWAADMAQQRLDSLNENSTDQEVEQAVYMANMYATAGGAPGDVYSVNFINLDPVTVPLKEGEKCEKVFGNATIKTYVPEAVANVISLIDAIGTVENTDECKQKIDAAKAAYDALTDAQKAIVTNAAALTQAENDFAAADAVIEKIDAIGEVVLTDECKQKIDAAREAYDALTDEQKALVSNYETLQLAEDKEALEAYKTAKKADMDALLQEGDSETVQSIVGLAKTAIDGAQYDESKTLDENKAALDDLVKNVPARVAEARTAEAAAAALAEAKEAAKAAIRNYKNAADYREAEQAELAEIIEKACAAIDAATDTAQISIRRSTTIASINQLKTAAEYEAEEAAAALADAKEQLVTAITAAKAFYDTIKDDEKYADIADALKTAYERGEAALASEDPAEILDFAANVAFALEQARADKAAADAQPEEPAEGTPIHGDHCFCYKYSENSTFGKLSHFICSILSIFYNVFEVFGVA